MKKNSTEIHLEKVEVLEDRIAPQVIQAPMAPSPQPTPPPNPYYEAHWYNQGFGNIYVNFWRGLFRMNVPAQIPYDQFVGTPVSPPP